MSTFTHESMINHHGQSLLSQLAETLHVWRQRYQQRRRALLDGRERPKAVEELQQGKYWIWVLTPARTYAALGRAEEAISFLRTADQWHPGEAIGWPMTTALLRMDPSWDPIRKHPKFVEKLAAAAAAEMAAGLPREKK